jgi:hypothetical protein
MLTTKAYAYFNSSRASVRKNRLATTNVKKSTPMGSPKYTKSKDLKQKLAGQRTHKHKAPSVIGITSPSASQSLIS